MAATTRTLLSDGESDFVRRVLYCRALEPSQAISAFEAATIDAPFGLEALRFCRDIYRGRYCGSPLRPGVLAQQPTIGAFPRPVCAVLHFHGPGQLYSMGYAHPSGRRLVPRRRARR